MKETLNQPRTFSANYNGKVTKNIYKYASNFYVRIMRNGTKLEFCSPTLKGATTFVNSINSGHLRVITK